MNPITKNYIKYLEENTFLKKNSIYAYSRIIERFLNTTTKTTNDKELINKINSFLIKINRENNEKFYSLAAIKHYLRYIHKSHLINQLITIPTAQPKKIKKFISINYIRKKVIPNIQKQKYKEAALIQAETGIRANEVLRININDIQLKEDHAEIIIHGKARKGKKLFVVSVVSKEAINIIKKILKQKEEYPFLYHIKNNTLEEDIKTNYIYYYKSIKEASEGKITTHDIRRAWALKVYLTFKDLFVLKEGLHHSDIKTSMKYIEGLRQIFTHKDILKKIIE